jgi:hypothetical protein
MAEMRVFVENLPLTDPANPGSLAQIPVTIPRESSLTGVYGYSLADANGVVAANAFLSIFNPVGSGKLLIAASAGISAYVVTGTPTPPLSSLHVHRITAASAGTLVADSDVFKYMTSDPDPIAEVRIGNPTVVEGPRIFCFPPGVNSSFDASRHQIAPTLGLGGVVLAPGEGVVFRTDSGDTEQVWNIDVTWAERDL